MEQGLCIYSHGPTQRLVIILGYFDVSDDMHIGIVGHFDYCS